MTWMKLEQVVSRHDVADMLAIVKITLAAFLTVIVVAEDLKSQHGMLVPAANNERIGVSQDLPGLPGEDFEHGFVHGDHPFVNIARREDDFCVRVCRGEFLDEETAWYIEDALEGRSAPCTVMNSVSGLRTPTSKSPITASNSSRFQGLPIP